MKKLKPFFAAIKNADTLELTVYEDIGQDWFGDGISAKSVKEKIDAAGRGLAALDDELQRERWPR